MNESLFTQGAFDGALPLGQPDFAMMMALAGVRQANSVTARLTVHRASAGAASETPCALSILAGFGVGDSGVCDETGSFFDLTPFDLRQESSPSGSERPVNLGISTNVQSLGLDASDRLKYREF